MEWPNRGVWVWPGIWLVGPVGSVQLGLCKIEFVNILSLYFNVFSAYLLVKW